MKNLSTIVLQTLLMRRYAGGTIIHVRHTSSSDFRARTKPGAAAQDANKNDPKIKKIINAPPNSSPSLKGEAEILDAAYTKGTPVTNVVDSGAVHYKPVTGSHKTGEKDPIGGSKRKFSTLVMPFIADKSVRFAHNANFATKVGGSASNPLAGSSERKLDDDVDRDRRNAGVPSSGIYKPAAKTPLGQVVGVDGIESIDGGHHSDSLDTKQKEKKDRTKHKNSFGSNF